MVAKDQTYYHSLMALESLNRFSQLIRKIKTTLYILRLVKWENKLSAIRPIFYVFLAYSFSISELSVISFLNLLSVIGIISSSYLVNDYYDNLLRSDTNYSSELIKKGGLTMSGLGFYVIVAILPALIFTIYLLAFRKESYLIAILLIIGFFISLAYSWPPIRLKDRVVGPLIFPLAATLLFLESWVIHKEINSEVITLGILVFTFQTYLELLHLISDTQDGKEIIRLEAKRSRLLALIVLGLGFLQAILFGFLFNFVFIAGSIFWLLRLVSFLHSKNDIINKKRSRLWSPLLSVYEFILYAVAGVLNIIQL